MEKLLKLIASTKLQDYTTYYSENPQVSIWKELLLFTDFNVLKKIWKSKSQDDYVYVSTSIYQAYEYYQASQQCSIKTKPLLLYYCFLNLTKGILFLKTGSAPNASYHGLAKPKMDDDILNVNAITNDGLFKDLMTFYKYNCTNGTTFSFKEFISGIPELTYEIKTYFNLDPKLYNLNVTNYIDGDIKISIPLNDFNSDSGFNSLLDDFDKTENETYIFLERKAKSDISSDQRLKESIKLINKYCVFSQLEYSYYFKLSKDILPIEASYFGSMFLLSSIVRYFPAKLSTFTIERGDNSAAWFINHFCDIASRVYPNLMLNTLMETQIRYE